MLSGDGVDLMEGRKTADGVAASERRHLRTVKESRYQALFYCRYHHYHLLGGVILKLRRDRCVLGIEKKKCLFFFKQVPSVILLSNVFSCCVIIVAVKYAVFRVLL